MTILALALAVLVQDQVDNPEFKHWKSFKPGSSVTHKVSPQGIQQKTTIKTVGKDEVVLQVEMTFGGQVMDKPTERKIAAKVPPAEVPKILKEGEEEIEVGGRKLKCRLIEYDQKLSVGVMANVKAWIHEEVPGGAARLEFTLEKAAKSSMVASAWEKK